MLGSKKVVEAVPAPAGGNGTDKREVPTAPMRSLNLLEHKSVRWRLDLPAGVRREDLESPVLWSVVSSKLKPLDLIEAVDEQATFWAELICAQGGRFAPIVKLLRVVDLPARTAASDDLPAGHSIVQDPRTGRWRGMRGEVVLVDETSYEQARFALLAHATLRG
ncbi:MAG: hypothetical protein M5U08_16455 [Burkholderiales bacterium]|nr:hypothetical protein [Burkholderiales bacterium]